MLVLVAVVAKFQARKICFCPKWFALQSFSLRNEAVLTVHPPGSIGIIILPNERVLIYVVAYSSISFVAYSYLYKLCNLFSVAWLFFVHECC